MIMSPPAMRQTWIQSLSWQDPLGGGCGNSNILAWRIPMDKRSWWSAAHGVAKSRTRLSDIAQQHLNVSKYCYSDSDYLVSYYCISIV